MKRGWLGFLGLVIVAVMGCSEDKDTGGKTNNTTGTASLGDSCEADGDCASACCNTLCIESLYCEAPGDECDNDGDCNGSEECQNGYCAAVTCSDDFDCADDEICDNGECVVDSTGPDPELAARCDDMCAKQIACMGEMGCAAALPADACASQCLDQAPTAASAAQFMALTCTDLNFGACTTAGAAQVCDCSDYQTCDSASLICGPLSTPGSGACVTSAGAVPADAPVCNNTTPCEAGSSCIVSSATATSGVCLKSCTIGG